MSADSLDNFSYKPAHTSDSPATRRHYWAVAIGLQDVDGLKVSPYLKKTAETYISGKQNLEETGKLIREYHAKGNDKPSLEADMVSQRIAEMLARGAFCLDPLFFAQVHHYLFQDLDTAVYHPGEFKTERMVKQEEILNGDSVLYADPLTYEMSLKGAFAAEQAKSYRTLTGDELASFCHFISFLWQIHPFYEGNTRTVAVFSELYLNFLGFNISNDPFEKHARYYRDALVRAMYRNVSAGVFPNSSFLGWFYENAIAGGTNTLNREDLMCTQLFENPSLLRNVNPEKALTRHDHIG